MKRSEALAGLSREHHGALSLAVRARRTAVGNDAAAVAAMAATVRERFQRELLPHFEEEERCLLPVLARAGENALVARTLAEHAELAALVASLPEAGAGALLAFGDVLARHVRFEEREVFPALEALAGVASTWDLPASLSSPRPAIQGRPHTV